MYGNWSKGEGVRDHMTAHGLRATCITRLFQAGHQKEVISSRTCHRDPSSELVYLNTDGIFGQHMQDDMFKGRVLEGADKRSRTEAVEDEGVICGLKQPKKWLGSMTMKTNHSSP